ncbi:DUF4145 domain-containing protein [Sphingomonas cavernae]|uniref:DUF4145 domain-containing protein n=1 Tax=Sphingomonas cavernae TaxID=2320861 RepID=UPI001C72650E|nr:DUF4145 domain-containing protein [Sphingomonas cavernae]
MIAEHFQVHTTVCSACAGAHIFLRGTALSGVFANFLAYPQAGRFPPPPPEVPQAIAGDYAEANLVLPISAKASAALSRRCLQHILASQGYNSKNLVDQIKAAIDERDASKSLPSSIRDNFDAVRNFGNFSAHPLTDKTTLQIVDVEESEAEWCLEIIQDLFDHYYVRPARAAEKRSALQHKLSSAGKPPMQHTKNSVSNSAD